MKMRAFCGTPLAAALCRCVLAHHVRRALWAADMNEGFQLGQICDFGTDTISVQPLSGGKIVEAA